VPYWQPVVTLQNAEFFTVFFEADSLEKFNPESRTTSEENSITVAKLLSG
jgi:hypothetical protein